MYWNQILGSFSSGLASPFIPYLAASIKFNSVEMGALQASQNLFPNLMQYPWGKLSDRLNNRIFFIMFGGVVSSLMFIAFMYHVCEITINFHHNSYNPIHIWRNGSTCMECTYW